MRCRGSCGQLERELEGLAVSNKARCEEFGEMLNQIARRKYIF
jgi:hypothetical protein